MTSPTSEPAVRLPPELAQIQAEAAAIAPPPLPEQGNQEQTAELPVDYLGEIQMLVDMAAGTLKVIYPSTATVLDDKARAELAAVYAPLAEKYGFTMGGFMARWGREIAAGYTTAMLIPPLASAISADRAAKAAAKQQAEVVQRDPDPQPVRAANDPYSNAFPAGTDGQN